MLWNLGEVKDVPVRKPSRRSSMQSPPTKAGFSLSAVFSGLAFSLIFAVIAFMVWSVIFALSSLPDNYMTYAAYLTSFLAVLFGGRRAAARAGGAGLLNGGLVGLVYTILLMAVATIVLPTPIGQGMAGWARPAIDIVAGIIGGVWGAGAR
jgi:putative membrane protein (TIGR04086 family)